MNREIPQATDEAQMRAFWRQWNELIKMKKLKRQRRSWEGDSMNITRQEIEEFLYQEAELLDEWKLKEWAALFSTEGTYVIPPIGSPDAKSKTSLF